MKISNITGIPLPLAVWLVHDDYDYVDKPNYISATTLMKPLRHIVLPKRVAPKQRSLDVADLIATSWGTAVHDSIEKAWTTGHALAMKKLGYPDHAIDRVLINPTPEELAAKQHPIPIYFEKRAFREIDGFTIGGKFDMVTEGIVNDFKSTSAYTWVYGGRAEEHKLQGSLYRWLNPDIITEDFIRIIYLFTDWQALQARTNKDYPQSRLEYVDIPLMSLDETESWVRAKLSLVRRHLDTPEPKLPHCTDAELWRSETVHKYYADPAKTEGKATKNFASLAEANSFKIQKGKGIVITVPGEVKRCSYCDAAPICTQRLSYEKPIT